MPYTPKTWENKPSTASPINATNLNHMEGGIKTNDDNILGAQNAILTLQGEMLQTQGDISALETLVDSIFPVDTETGNPAVITDAFGGACKSLKLTLEPIQSGSGTPSPSNPLPISGYTQAKITRAGNDISGTLINNRVINYVDGSDFETSGYSITDYIPVLAGQSITAFNCMGGSENWFYNSSKVGVSAIPKTPSDTVRTYTAPYDGYVRFSLPTSNADIFRVGYSVDYVVDIGQTVYGGVLDVMSGVLTINKVGVDMGGLEWTYQNTAGRFYIDLADLLPPTSDSIAFSGSASNCKIVAANRRDAETDAILFVFGGQNRVYTKNFTDTSVASFQATMNGQVLCYELATPSTVQLTAEEVALLHGDNVLTADADSIEASYSADIALYIAKKIAEGSQNNRNLSKGGSGDEEAKEEENEIKEEEPLTKEVR